MEKPVNSNYDLKFLLPGRKKQRELEAGSSVPLLNKTVIKKMDRAYKREKIIQAKKKEINTDRL